MYEKKHLQELIVDERDLLHKIMTDSLKPILGLSKETDNVVPTVLFTELNYKQRIVAYLLARHAMVELNIPNATQEADIEKISRSTMLPKARCSENLSRLKDDLVESNENGWFVPKNKIILAANFIKGSAV